jgi:hypothetical protein
VTRRLDVAAERRRRPRRHRHRHGRPRRDLYGRVDHLEAHRHRAGPNHAQHARRGIREVDDATVDERAAIVDANLDGAAVREARHHGARAERQRLMCRRELVLVVDLAVRGALAVEAGSIPGGDALLPAVDDRRRHGSRERARGHGDAEHDPEPAPPPPHPSPIMAADADARKPRATRRRAVVPSACPCYPQKVSVSPLRRHHVRSFQVEHDQAQESGQGRQAR